tara:strand:- start:336 stop:641 length:306 start_codon:yes stop_codon:yes gene_type:complete
MILFFFFIYSVISLLICFFIRGLLKNIHLKRLFFSFFFSLFITVWFSMPGSNQMAPIFSIMIVNVLEGNEFFSMRIFRPFITSFVFIIIIDYLLFLRKTKI